MRSLVKLNRLVVVLVTPIIVTGCGDQSIQEKLADYNDSVEKTRQVLTNFYGNLNGFARQSYISYLRFHPEQKMYMRVRRGYAASDSGQAGAATSERSYPTGIPYRFSPDGICTRLLVVQALADYSKGLAALASADAPEKVQAEVETLGNGIVQVGQDWAAFSKKGSDAEEIASFGGPLTKFAALIGASWVSHKQLQFLKGSIKATNSASNELFDLLEEDVRSLNAGLYGNETNEMVNDYIAEYNSSYVGKKTHTEPERVQYLKEINEIVASQAGLQNSDPLSLIQDMRKLHDDLYQVVQGSKGNKKNLALESAVFKNDAQACYKRLSPVSNQRKE